LVLKAGAWYLVAAVDGQVRTDRVARILGLEVLAEGFARPADFDLAAYWRSWSAQFQTRLRPHQAIVRFSPRALEILPHLFDAATTRTVRESAGPPDVGGWVRATFPIESLAHGPIALLRFGGDAEVLAPPELRDRMVEAAALSRLYR
jgi:predicted DNA-binding transcriptional regulator YafY